MNFSMPWNTNKASDSWAASIEDIKQQLGQQVDRLGKIISDAGREVATQAAQVPSEAAAQAGSAARDLRSQAVRAGQDARSQASTVARDIPVTAGSLAQQARQNVAQLGRDLRSVRITREPQRRGPDIMPGVALLAGVGSGLAIMYFFDPNEGRRRRSLLRDQLVKWTRVGRESATGKAKDVRNRTVGVMYEAKKQVTGITEGEQGTDTMRSPSSSRLQGNGSADTTPAGEPSQEPVISERI